MDIKKIWNSTRLFKTNGLTFSERIVQNFLIIGFMFGSSILIVTLMFGFALALAWVLAFIMPQFTANIVSIIITVFTAISVFGAAIDSDD